jgi:hypothetical protein
MTRTPHRVARFTLYFFGPSTLHSWLLFGLLAELRYIDVHADPRWLDVGYLMMGEWEGEGEGEARRVPLLGPAPCAVSAPGKERGLLYQSRFVFCFSFFFFSSLFLFRES